MKRIVSVMLCVLLAAVFFGCAKKVAVKNTIEGNMKTYYEMTDGTWKCDDRVYKYRLEINGRMPNAAADSTFVYLSNIEEITFEQAYRAAWVSSDINDYFSPDDAVLVEMN
ncbi:MAG: immunogenic protein [Clostridia bacterium]|nr:immunogenic protein [Clostridia bacterium]